MFLFLIFLNFRHHVYFRRRKNITDEEFDRKFLTDAAVADLYVYKSFDKPINSKPKKSIKLHLANKKHVPGLKYHRLIKRKSLLTKITKFHCLEALKVIQSGKRQDLLTRKETNSLTVYNVRLTSSHMGV